MCRKSGLALILVSAVLGAAPASAQRVESTEKKTAAETLYCEERKLGYWFYCSRPASKNEARQGAAGEPESLPATRELEAITSELRELKARAILYPTKSNVAAYVRFQRAQLDRASLFSDVWQRAIWQDPDLDYTLQRPVGALAKKQWQDVRAAERDSVMARLSQRYGLFYFFSATCGPCEVMSPIVKGVAGRWGITVRAISTDGGPSHHFPDFKIETNQRARLGLEGKATPALVLWDSVTKRPIPIGYGVLSADELQNRIYLLTSKEAGHDY
ncbi:conjugal transfer protein TraF [Erythrobacter sp. SCSIO 43205]|uniref:conjugal transfer protein TraF n=1 Tax=Erythrobacter sp. SCSIO 43205 TaxID=2779361 RepID=UPI001CA8D68F|nr:conjugal transfer protein TraF [Erythrobacter sp. SCSIO 43205]UAB79654.1 conjugal transfer protein TraF [Erythrobacter sp. SCSIO 43205]